MYNKKINIFVLSLLTSIVITMYASSIEKLPLLPQENIIVSTHPETLKTLKRTSPTLFEDPKLELLIPTAEFAHKLAKRDLQLNIYAPSFHYCPSYHMEDEFRTIPIFFDYITKYAQKRPNINEYIQKAKIAAFLKKQLQRYYIEYYIDLFPNFFPKYLTYSVTNLENPLFEIVQIDPHSYYVTSEKLDIFSEKGYFETIKKENKYLQKIEVYPANNILSDLIDEDGFPIAGFYPFLQNNPDIEVKDCLGNQVKYNHTTQELDWNWRIKISEKPVSIHVIQKDIVFVKQNNTTFTYFIFSGTMSNLSDFLKTTLVTEHASKRLIINTFSMPEITAALGNELSEFMKINPDVIIQDKAGNTIRNTLGKTLVNIAAKIVKKASERAIASFLGISGLGILATILYKNRTYIKQIARRLAPTIQDSLESVLFLFLLSKIVGRFGR